MKEKLLYLPSLAVPGAMMNAMAKCKVKKIIENVENVENLAYLQKKAFP